MDPFVRKVRLGGLLSFPLPVIEFELRNLNVLIGANGSGKSNFIEAMLTFREIADGRLESYVQRKGGAERLLWRGSKTSPGLELGLEFGSNRYLIALVPVAGDALAIASEHAGFIGDKNPNYWRLVPAQGLNSGLDLQVRVDRYVIDGLRSIQRYHFHDTGGSAGIKKIQPVARSERLDGDGQNLGPFLWALRENYPTSYRNILATVRLVAPFVEDLVLEPFDTNLGPCVRLDWRHPGIDNPLLPDQFSDGTLRFLALTAALLQPNPPKLMLFDEPELGLHPAALEMLAAMFHEAAARTQVILTTQSPYLVDKFQPEDIIVADRVEQGTQLRRLERKELQDWLEEFSLGQIWVKHLVGGQP